MLRCLLSCFLLGLLGQSSLLLKPLLFLFSGPLLDLVLFLLLALLLLLLLLVLLGLPLGLPERLSFLALLLLLLLDFLPFQLSLLLFLLSFGVSLSPFEPLELFFDLELLVFGGLCLFGLFDEGSHTFFGKGFELFYAARAVELGKFFENAIGGIPGRPQIPFSLFFNYNLLEDALSGLFTALGVLVIEVVNDLLLRLEGNVAGSDELRTELEYGIWVSLAKVVHLLRLLAAQGHGEPLKADNGEVF